MTASTEHIFVQHDVSRLSLMMGQTKRSVWLQKGSKISVPMKSAAHFKMVIYESCKHMTGLVRLR